MAKTKRKQRDDARFPVESDPRFARIPTARELEPQDERFGLDGRFAEPDVDQYGEKKKKGAGFEWDAASTSEEEEEQDADQEYEEEPHVWENDVEVGDASKRLAVMGVDWDQCDARDLYVMVQTFLESERASGAACGGGARVVAARVYTSEFGRAKLKEEEEHGPDLEGFAVDAAADEEEKKEARLRAYAKQRLQYFFGVLELDSVETSNFIYEQLDGMHADMLTPRNLELQYIPDDLELPGAPTSACTESPSDYEPPVMKSNTLSHSKGGFAFDQQTGRQQRDRNKVMTKRYSEKDLVESDLKAYLASSSDEDMDEDGLADYRQQLLGAAADEESSEDGLNDEERAAFDAADDEDSANEEDQLLDINFNPVADGAAAAIAQKAKQQLKQGTLTKEGFGVATAKNSWQKYLEKKKEKKAARKAEIRQARQKAKEAQIAAAEPKKKAKKKWNLGSANPGPDADQDDAEAEAALLVGDEDDRHFNMKKKGKKREADDVEGIDVRDARISKIFSDDAFAIDPTHPEYKKSAGMKALLEEKVARRKKKQKRGGDEPVSEAGAKSGAKPSKKQVAADFSLFA